MKSYHRAQQNLQIAAERHPLATGAACLGFGLLVGFLLPKSTREDEWFGERSSAVKERVKDAGQDLVDRGKHVAQAATQAVRSEAERQGLTPEHLKESLKAVGQESSQAATGNKQSSESGQRPENPSI